MSEAGMSDDLITAYIQKSASSYALDADQVVYLHDLGVSSVVLKALVDHSQPGATSEAAEASSGTAGTESVPSGGGPVVTAPLTPPVSGAAVDFYDSLAPYGSWVDVPNYGWCWQPTVVAVNPAWQPYCNDGSWLWSDNGWYWNSYYSWGWAPFHYGRWYRYPRYGWLWCPDNVWGPAWVCWRDYPGYCGWAPLPPGAFFTAGIGWTFNGIAVGFNFGFGLGFDCFTFCDFDHFCGRHSFDHFRHGRDADHFFRGSRVNNDFAVDSRHGFINRGIDPSRIEAATHTRIQQVAVRELPRAGGRSGDLARPDRLSRAGGSAVIYRPGRDISAARDRVLPGRNITRDNFATTRGLSNRRMAENTSRMQPVRPSATLRSAPGASLNVPQRSGSTFNQPRSGAGSSRVVRPLASPGYGSGNTYSRPSAPAWRSAPSYTPRSAPLYTPRSTPSYRSWSRPSFSPRSAPSWSAPRSFSRSAPSFGGTRPSGGGGRSVGGSSFGGGGGNRSGGGTGSGHGSRR